jgi:hypothetical protein
MDWVEDEALPLLRPGFTDVFVGCEAGEGFERRQSAHIALNPHWDSGCFGAQAVVAARDANVRYFFDKRTFADRRVDYCCAPKAVPHSDRAVYEVSPAAVAWATSRARETCGVAASHAAFSGDAIDTRIAAGGGEAGHVAGRIVVVNEAEIELGLRVEGKAGKWLEVGIVSTVLRHRQVEIVDRAPDPGADRIDHLHHQTGMLGLDQMLVGRAAVAEVIAELDAGGDALADFRQ